MTRHDGRRLKFWGWGYEDQQPAPAEVARDRGRLARAPRASPPAESSGRRAGGRRAAGAPARPAPGAGLDLPHATPTSAPRTPTASPTATSSGRSAAASTTRRTWSRTPRDEAELEAVLDWCERGGRRGDPVRRRHERGGRRRGRRGRRLRAASSPSTSRGSTACSTSTRSRARRGSRPAPPGPGSRRQLREHGLTLRHYPQSFEYSTLGGWIATRAGGHFATLGTHIDDCVESVRALTPRGLWESRRLPGSGAGPSPDRMLIGSEGILGVITEAWVRVRERPRFRASAARDLRLLRAKARARCARSPSRGSTRPTAGCSIRARPRLTGAAQRRRRAARARLRVGRPSARRVDGAGARAVPRPRRRAASERERRRRAEPGATRSCRCPTCATRSWRPASSPRPSRPRSPGTASTSSSRACAARTLAALGEGTVTCRLTHAYPDGAAPYFTVLAPARRGAELEQWDEVKAAASEAILAAGGTITHHHAVGPRPPALVRPPAPRRLRGGPAGRQAGARSGGDPEPGRADRSDERAQARAGARRPRPAGPVAAAPAAALAGRAARERLRDRGRATASCWSTPASTSPARCASSSGRSTRPRVADRARAAARLHPRALGPLRPGRADPRASGLRALDAPEPSST